MLSNLKIGKLIVSPAITHGLLTRNCCGYMHCLLYTLLIQPEDAILFGRGPLTV